MGLELLTSLGALVLQCKSYSEHVLTRSGMGRIRLNVVDHARLTLLAVVLRA